MLLRKLTLFIMLLLMSCSMVQKEKKATNGFDSACSIFQKAATMKLNPQERGDYISAELDNMEVEVASDDVKEVYHALFNVDPTKRYELFKESAETTLNRSWDCDAIKALYMDTHD